MNARELIELLSKLPPDVEVCALYDGSYKMELDCVWLSRQGTILIASSEEAVDSTEDRPEGAPTREEKPWWRCPNMIESGQ